MKNVNIKLLLPTAEEMRMIVQTAYDFGIKRGREEAKQELQSLVSAGSDGPSKVQSKNEHGLDEQK